MSRHQNRQASFRAAATIAAWWPRRARIHGLLRQYFPRRESLAGITQEQLDEVAAKLNRRPRKTLGFHTPAEKLQELIDGPETTGAER